MFRGIGGAWRTGRARLHRLQQAAQQGHFLLLQPRPGEEAAHPLHVVNVSAEVTDTAAAEALGLEAARQLRAAGGQVCLDAAAALSAGA